MFISLVNFIDNIKFEMKYDLTFISLILSIKRFFAFSYIFLMSYSLVEFFINSITI